MSKYDASSLSGMFDIDRLLIRNGFSLVDLEKLSFADYHTHYMYIVNQKKSDRK